MTHTVRCKTQHLHRKILKTDTSETDLSTAEKTPQKTHQTQRGLREPELTVPLTLALLFDSHIYEGSLFLHRTAVCHDSVLFAVFCACVAPECGCGWAVDHNKKKGGSVRPCLDRSPPTCAHLLTDPFFFYRSVRVCVRRVRMRLLTFKYERTSETTSAVVQASQTDCANIACLLSVWCLPDRVDRRSPKDERRATHRPSILCEPAATLMGR